MVFHCITAADFVAYHTGTPRDALNKRTSGERMLRAKARASLSMAGEGCEVPASAGTTGQGAGTMGRYFHKNDGADLFRLSLTACDAFRRAGRRDAWRTQVAWSDGRCAAGLT